MTKLILTFLTLFIIIGCNNNSRLKKKLRNRAINGVTQIEYSVNKTYPHSINSFTEGLLFHDNKLFESTGSPENYPNTRSVIGIVDLKTGKIDVKIEIDKKYFGEGILIFSNKLYQLTYKNQLGFIYNLQDFKQIGTFNYSNTEGWGMSRVESIILHFQFFGIPSDSHSNLSFSSWRMSNSSLQYKTLLPLIKPCMWFSRTRLSCNLRR